MKKFDKIISLGYNCEVTFRFIKYFNFEETSLFNWHFSYSIDDLISALKNFDKLGVNFEYPNPLYECKNTKLRFHSKLDINLVLKNLVEDSLIEEDKKDLTEKIKYLKNKFLNVLKSNETKLYIYKIKNEDVVENVYSKIEALYNALSFLGGVNFKLLIVSEKNSNLNFKDTKNIYFRKINYFAPDEDVVNLKYLKNGWNKIFDEFKPNEIKKPKIKKYKFDKNPLVSVLIPSYNHQNYVQNCIKSIIDQTYQDIELIVIDDGSKDETFNKIKEMEEQCNKRFLKVHFETKQNEGTTKTFNKLLNLAGGDFVLIIASDDVLSNKNAINKMVKFLAKNPGYVLAVGDNELIDGENRRCYWDFERNNVYDKKNAVYKTFSDFLRKETLVKFNSADFGRYETFLYSNYIPNGYLIKKSALDTIGGFKDEAPLEDYYLHLQLSKLGKYKYFDEVFFSYRWHGANSITNREKMDDFYEKTINYEYEVVQKEAPVTFFSKNGIKYGFPYKIFEIPFIFKLTKFKKRTGEKHKILTIFGFEILHI